jgi:serine/threonine protein kinase
MRECPRCESCYDDEVTVCPDDSADTKHTLPGGRVLVGRYLLEKRLGRGAMGQVYLARDQNLVTRRVAVKTVRPDILTDEGLQEGEAIARFEREARAAASIRHPNVVDVTDFGKSADGVFFLVMEYVEGETLHELLRREGTLSLHRAVALMSQVIAGVDAAHDAGILHRDLKPANIFIMQSRKRLGSAQDSFVKVGDFGLAKIVYSDRAEVTSASGPASRGIIGTPEYMAPEQMQEGVQLDAKADLYALGSIAYHMLGGRPPFTGSITQLIAQKLLQEPQKLSDLRTDIPREVEQVIMRALAKDLAARPSGVSEWFEDLENAARESGESNEPSESRVVIMAPSGAEVYVDDERQGSVGRSGRVVLTSIAPGQHVLRIARIGEDDDERVIEIRPDGAEQIIQTQFKSAVSSQHLTPSKGGSLDSRTGTAPLPAVVACMNCGSRFAKGVKFCGKCGNISFKVVSAVDSSAPTSEVGTSTHINCPRCNHPHPKGTKFCGRCGIPMGNAPLDWDQPRPVEVVCRYCNTTYRAGTRFCGRCGHSMVS